ncbi:ZIP family metal transporter [Chitinispirillales bacterium ANBcel5]|uniref:ZIP family metal transporter n=1 Tax=Cellulosispirillum alkaliphilum TaxID=3039283 RepID=UPI002A541314|nr:ZIP family metal transporter [Chitinispirillales bacterium ANBcel5]
MLYWILLATLSTSLMAFVGALTLFFRSHILKLILSVLVAFSAGTLLGASFIHLIPEAFHERGVDEQLFLWLLLGFTVMFLLEQTISWHHCNFITEKQKKAPVTYMILVADGVHNFIDGLAIGGAFIVSFEAGIAVWVASIAHEIPQELGEFGVLLHGGWKKGKALLFNFISALSIVPGGVVAYFAAQFLDMTFLLPFAAGTFIYIAASDLIPEVKHTEELRDGLKHFVAFIAGMALMYLIESTFHH